jgi:hypothetical protein
MKAYRADVLLRRLFYGVYRLTVALWLFQETLKPEKTRKEATSGEIKNIFERIRCPRCKWRPLPSSRWFCGNCDDPEYFSEGCGTTWNTFTTRGRCPGCNHQWIWTSCLRCAAWSRHEDWYEKDQG